MNDDVIDATPKLDVLDVSIASRLAGREPPEGYRSAAKLAERLLRRIRLCKGADGVPEWVRMDLERKLSGFLAELRGGNTVEEICARMDAKKEPKA